MTKKTTAKKTVPAIKANKKTVSRGFALIAAILAVAVIGVLAFYVSSFTITENKISSTQSDSVKAYYLAESGVADAINKIKNDSAWKTAFETDPSWNQTYTKSDALYPGSSYTIQISNTALAHGIITVTGNYTTGNKVSKRIMKALIFKASGGTSTLDTIGIYSYGEIKTQSANNITINNGGLHSNGNIITNASTNLTVQGAITAVGSNNLTAGNVHADSTRDKHSNPPVAIVEMPSVSFDNAGDPNSLKARAAHVYTPTQFANTVLNNSIITLTGINYVTGDINITGAKIITINGALVSDGSININGAVNMTVNQPTTSTPAGLIAKNNITFTAAANVNLSGIIYGNNTCDMSNSALNLTVNGAIICMNTNLKGTANLTINTNPQRTAAVLGSAGFSPVVTVQHWEEEY
jgi:Tfp pilus assembly protein PilX